MVCLRVCLRSCKGAGKSKKEWEWLWDYSRMAVINGFIKLECDFHLNLTTALYFKQDVSIMLHIVVSLWINWEFVYYFHAIEQGVWVSL